MQNISVEWEDAVSLDDAMRVALECLRLRRSLQNRLATPERLMYESGEFWSYTWYADGSPYLIVYVGVKKVMDDEL